MIMNNINFILDSNRCCGCGNCQLVCPQNAIELITDDEGFSIPHIDKKKCINCGLCIKKCPMIIKENFKEPILKAVCYYGWRSDSSIRNMESSGGAFGVLADVILNMNGSIYGAAFTERFYVRHIRVTNKDELPLLFGSKYVQSSIEDIMEPLILDLKKGKKVLFSGTPCQCMAVKAFCSQYINNLYLIEIICHGVPSPRLFANYLSYLEGKYKGELKRYSFRDKNKYHSPLCEKFTINNNKRRNIIINPFYMSAYYYGFLYGMLFRESCYQCPYANPKRLSDITIGDFWNIKKLINEEGIEKGISLIICNTEKGKTLLSLVNGDDFEKHMIDHEIALKSNEQLNHPFIRPNERDNIYKNADFENRKWRKKYFSPKPYFIKWILSKTTIKQRNILKRIIGWKK